jgi:glutamate synthase (NADPH/NADH) large chain
VHNGEINTLRGNVNWMNARERQFKSEKFGDDMKKVLPVLNQDGSEAVGRIEDAADALPTARRI